VRVKERRLDSRPISPRCARGRSTYGTRPTDGGLTAGTGKSVSGPGRKSGARSSVCERWMRGAAGGPSAPKRILARSPVNWLSRPRHHCICLPPYRPLAAPPGPTWPGPLCAGACIVRAAGAVRQSRGPSGLRRPIGLNVSITIVGL
jgi:hypothetical protein